METNELTNSIQDQTTVLVNQPVEQNTVTDSVSDETNETVVESETPSDLKRESAADIILRKFADKKKGVKEISLTEELKEELKELQINSSISNESETAIQIEDEVELPENEASEVDELLDEEEHLTLINYADFSKEDLVTSLKELVDNKPVQDIRNDVESIKTNFYKKLKAEIAEVRRVYLEEGGDPLAFKIEPDKIEIELKELYNKYKNLRNDFNSQIEKRKIENLKAKNQIIEELKNLVNGNETMNKTFQDFKELQRKWREIGIVPQSDVRALWENYHYHVEKFYDFVNINKELRDLDLRKNQEIKMSLCEKSEELLLEPMVVKAFRALQKLHNQWRETGPVPHEKKDEIWERFKDATTQINKKHQEYFEKVRVEQDNNLKAKTLLCEKAEEIAGTPLDSRKDWDKKSDEILELQKIWKLIGFAPKKDNNRIYGRFRNACDVFFSKKRDFFALQKENFENNLQMKTDLCVQAETMIESTEWKKNTEFYINLQKQWKTIGPVPRKVSDAIWNRFRAACNAFFEKKSSHFATIDAEQDKNLLLKQELIEQVKAYQFVEDNELNLDQLKNFQKQWMEIGHVPIQQKDELQRLFREAINEQFNKLNAEDSGRSEFRFKSRIETLKNSPKANDKIKAEREKIRSKIEQLQTNIVLWENNIGFFAKSKNAEAMIIEFNKKIEDAKDKVKQYKSQLDLIEKN